MRQWIEVRIMDATPGMTPIQLGRVLMPNSLEGLSRAKFLMALMEAYMDHTPHKTVDLLIEDVCPKCRVRMLYERLTDKMDHFICNSRACEEGTMTTGELACMLRNYPRSPGETFDETWKYLHDIWRKDRS